MTLKAPCEHGKYDPHETAATAWPDFESCRGGTLFNVPVVYREQERNDDLRRALGKGRLAPWEQDIERLLNRDDALLDVLERGTL